MMTQLSYEELKALVRLNRLGCRKQVLDLLKEGVPPSEVLVRSAHFRRRSKEEGMQASPLQELDPEKELAECEKLGIRLLTWLDEDYPPLLKEIHDPPFLLYMQGTLAENDIRSIL